MPAAFSFGSLLTALAQGVFKLCGIEPVTIRATSEPLPATRILSLALARLRVAIVRLCPPLRRQPMHAHFAAASHSRSVPTFTISAGSRISVYTGFAIPVLQMIHVPHSDFWWYLSMRFHFMQRSADAASPEASREALPR
jgi:hypothetical protein